MIIAPWQGWLGTVVGILLFIAVFIKGLQTGAGYLWTDLILGVLIAISGFGALSKTQSE